jgi:hypothetical protein
VLAKIMQASAEHFMTSFARILGHSRDRSICEARNVAIYVAHKHTGLSYPEIGRAMGRKCHSAALSATRRVAGWIETDPRIAAAVKKLEEQLGVNTYQRPRMKYERYTNSDIAKQIVQQFSKSINQPSGGVVVCGVELKSESPKVDAGIIRGAILEILDDIRPERK